MSAAAAVSIGSDMRVTYLLLPAGLSLLGQTIAMPTDAGFWVRALIDTGGLGVLAWLIYYGVTRIFPAMTQQHAATIKTLTDAFSREMKVERDAHGTELRQERESHRAELETLHKQVTQTLLQMVENSHQKD